MYGLVKDGKTKEEFIKTGDSNIVDRYRVVKDEIYINKLQKQIDDIQSRIDNNPKKIEYPVGVSNAVKGAIDEHNAMVIPTKELEEEKTHFEELKAKVEGAK